MKRLKVAGVPSCLPTRRTCCDPWRKSFRGVNGGVAETQGSRASMAPADFGHAAVGFYVKWSVRSRRLRILLVANTRELSSPFGK